MNPVPWVGDAVLPNAQSGSAYRVFAGDAYRAHQGDRREDRRLVADLSAVVGEGLQESGDRALPDAYVRGSHGIDYKERIKIMKLLWDAIGTEFGGRHELYEYNYAGNHEDIRIHALLNAKGSGAYDRMIALAEQCMADYDEDGWTGDTWIDPDDPGDSRRQPCVARGASGSHPSPESTTLLPHELDRPTPRHGRRLRAPSPKPRASSRRLFREAMSRLGAAVHVITTDGPAARPASRRPRSARCRTRRRRCWSALTAAPTSMPILRGNGVFCVNTLRAGDELIADTFAGRTKVAREARFDTGEWSDAVDRLAGLDERGDRVRLPGDRNQGSRVA